MAEPIRQPEPADRAIATTGMRWQEWLGSFGVYLFVAVLLVIGRIQSPGFLSGSSLLQVILDVSILGIAAVGVAMVTISGNYVDLTMPGIMAVAGIVTVALLPYGFWPAVAAGLGVGTLLGVINGAVVGYLRLNPIIWTLAAMALIDGITRWAYGGKWVYATPGTPEGDMFAGLYRARFLGAIPAPVILFAAAALLIHLVLRHTRYGQQLILTGSSYDVARLTGVKVQHVVMVAFVLSAAMSALAGILLTSLSMYGDVETGLTYDFQAITAVVLGGVVLAGGRGSVPGILGGVLVMGLLGRILPLLPGIDQDRQLAIRGAVFVAVVAFSAYSLRKAGRGDD